MVRKASKKLLFSRFEQTGFFTRFIGLLFRRSFSVPLLFVGNGSMAIHSFFCPRFEAVFLDRRRRITSIVFAEPRQTIKRSAFYLFEFPPGTVSRHGLQKGDELAWSDK